MTVKKASLGKRVAASRAAHTVMVGLLRLYRYFGVGMVLPRVDPRLHAVLRSDDPVIWAVWHQDLMQSMAYIGRWNSRRRTFPLASASRDGGLAAAAGEGMGFRPAFRGSSARGGGKALLQMTRLLKRDPRASVAVVCDGPRPPARVLKPGILLLAQKSGLPIWLMRTSTQRPIVLRKTWAKFQIPRPFSRCVALVDGPIHVPPNLGREAMEALRADVEKRLNDLAARADHVVLKL